MEPSGPGAQSYVSKNAGLGPDEVRRRQSHEYRKRGGDATCSMAMLPMGASVLALMCTLHAMYNEIVAICSLRLTARTMAMESLHAHPTPVHSLRT